MRSKICGRSLNGWVTFIGLLYLIQAIISSTLLITNLIKYKEDKEKATAVGEPYDDEREVVSSLCVSLSFSLTFVLTTPLLLWGVYKEKHLFIVPWLYNSVFCIIVNGIFLLVIILKNLYKLNKTQYEVYNFVLMTLTMALGLTLQLIFYRIVYKFYKELLSERALEYLENTSTLFLVYEEPSTNQT